ncbi:hypothetical protein ACFWY5_54735 [Nonomuraea sp. NPDC059007]|uniref:hypothetical protein n=1 Tax=Nonomuraea sp. NPDC059007 TaxID=3346692 RepID=UPI00369F390B
MLDQILAQPFQRSLGIGVFEQAHPILERIEPAQRIAPMNPHGWWRGGPTDEPPGTRDALAQYAQDVDVEVSTLLDRRWVASRWPKERRREGISRS